GVVGRHVGGAHQAVDRREVDDAAATCAPHVGNHVLGAEEHALHIDRLHAVPLGLGELVGGLVGAGDTGIVDQHVDATVVLGHAVDGLLDRAFVGDVDMPVACGHAAAVQLAGEPAAGIVVDVEQRQLRALFGKPGHARPANAGGGAGDDADPVRDAIH